MASATSSVDLESLPVGFRFSPNDEELVNYYLKQKMMGNNHLDSIIPEVNIYKFEPWDLPQKSMIKSDDTEWYFMCPRVLKYANSQRANRTTVAGYWKVTGKGRKVRSKGTRKSIAKTRNLVFHSGRFPNGIKTNWVMHEYLASFKFPQQKNFVLCKIMKNMDKMPTVEDGELSPVVSSDFENQIPNENIVTAISEEGESSHEVFPPGSVLQNYPIYEEGECSHKVFPPGSELQTTNEIIVIPISDEGELNPQMASGFENQNTIKDHCKPTFVGAHDPAMDLDLPFNVAEEDYMLWANLESFNGCDDNDYSLNSALYST